mgnify:CR=1 FL=1
MHISKPTLLIDPDTCRNNIRTMNQKALDHGLVFRPHFKTHQSKQIGRWFRQEGIDRITVSSVDMARYFAEDGWEDITLAFPLNIHEIPQINELAGQIRLNLTILNTESIEALEKGINHPVGIFLKIDTGAQRTGIPHDHPDKIIAVRDSIARSSRLKLKGLLAHAGHTYHAGSREEILRIHQETRDRLVRIREMLKEDDEQLIISVGDTPSCSLAEEFEGIDEIRPGNFVFYDMQQYKLNACSTDHIEVALAAPVVAKHKERGQIILYGGAVHLSKDTFIEGSTSVYGYGALINEKGWSMPAEKIIVSGVSQEHGILNVTPYRMERLSIGDFIGILPSHSCLTANLMGEYTDLEGHVYDHMKGKRRDS